MQDLQPNFVTNNLKASGVPYSLTLKSNLENSSIHFSGIYGLTGTSENSYYNNKLIQPGELVLGINNNIEAFIDAEINDEGELIISGPDAHNYSIDIDGNLIYSTLR